VDRSSGLGPLRSIAVEVWVGFAELRPLPGTDHPIKLEGKGAFTWITCWAADELGFLSKASEVMGKYGLFLVDAEQVMPFPEAESAGIVDEELAEQFENTSKTENFCIYGTFYNYPADN
jgi:hypothetical protein